MKDKKKFNETKVGKFLANNVPEALEALDGIPAVGAIKSVLKLVGVNLPQEKQEEFNAALAEYEKEMFALEVQDRDSARNRETEFVKATGQIDRFMFVLGMYVLLAFGFCMYVTVYVELPEAAREMFIEIRATTRDMLIGIGTYYWGSSAGSRIKDMRGK
jgi:hypothetical protein